MGKKMKKKGKGEKGEEGLKNASLGIMSEIGHSAISKQKLLIP